jgi:hypothetical protein
VSRSSPRCCETPWMSGDRATAVERTRPMVEAARVIAAYVALKAVVQVSSPCACPLSPAGHGERLRSNSQDDAASPSSSLAEPTR